MTMTVGVIGLGVMGTPIARHLLAAGFAVVGHDIVDEALVCFEAMGGKRARSARNVAERTEVVLTLLPSAAALQDVTDGPDGLNSAHTGATVVAECSTLPIPVKNQARGRLGETGKILLDCPLSGTGAQAETGDLVVLGSGPQAAYDLCLPAFQAMSPVQHHSAISAMAAG